MLLFTYYADALLNVASIYSLIDHCDGVVGIADHALTLGIECQFLAAEDVLAGARTVCPEITGRADTRKSIFQDITQVIVIKQTIEHDF